MSGIAFGPATGSIRVNLFDGRRQPVPADLDTLIRILDGNKQEVRSGDVQGPNIPFPGLPYHDNAADLYTVFASARGGYRDAAAYPVHLQEGRLIDVDLMVLPENGSFHFDPFDSIATSHPLIYRALVNGAADAAAARQNFNNAKENTQQLGCLLNIFTAMETIPLPDDRRPTPLYYDWQIEWDLLAPDRFYAWVDADLVGAVRAAADAHAFAEEQNPENFHKGIPGRIQPATVSWKQTRFDVANVQLTFHERDQRTIAFPDGQGGTRLVQCVIAEPDIDYYKDLLAHGLFEVLPNWITGNKSDPQVVYLLRWVVSRQERVAEFNPPTSIEA